MSKKAKKALGIIGIILLVLAILIGGFFYVIKRDSKEPAKEVTNTTNPYITQLGDTMVSAHRSGGGIAPENTMMAFKNCVENVNFKIDIFEFDLHLTKDNQLVLLHDGTLDRTSDAAEVFGRTENRPEEYTYEELRSLNMGEYFKTDDGRTPYQGLRGDAIPEDLKIVRLQDIFYYLQPYGDYRFIIEIKNGEELGRRAVDQLYSTLKEYGKLGKAVIGTFNGEISDYMTQTYPDMLRSAGIKEVVGFYFSALLGLDRAPDTFKFVALQIPDDDFVFNLGTTRLVNYAHKYNIAVQYWTINDPEDMKHLQSIGADAIMSDLPDLAYETLKK